MTSLPAKKKSSRLLRELTESADYLHSIGGIADAAHAKITKRAHEKIPPGADPVSAAEIRGLREKANMSQAMFARHLNVTTGYVSQLERGAKRPAGPALVLLNVIRRKGIAALS